MVRKINGRTPVRYALGSTTISSDALEKDAFSFNSALRRLDRLADCAALFRDRIAPYGFDTFACGEFDQRDRDRTVFYIIDWPESWRAFYIGSGLIERDPILDQLNQRVEAFTWNDLRRDRKLSKLGSNALDLARTHGWHEGLIVPIGGKGHRTGLVSLAGHSIIDVDAARYLTLISICLHHHARTLVVREGYPVPPAGLSEREIAATRLVAMGLSDAEIGVELGVARSTAHEFVEKAKRRLKVRTRAELIAIATALAIVDI